MLERANNKKHILLVDDDKHITQMLSMLLETRGYDVEVALSGKEAFRKITVHTDLIILDLVLPDQEGLLVCQRIKENKSTAHIPIIILSGKLLSANIVEGLYLGADDYLRKPFEYEELVARMEAVMRRSSTFNNGDHSEEIENGEIVLELKKIIKEGLITTFFQPIFLLKPFKLFGLEVLSRPQKNTILSNPEVLFKAAVQFGCYHELEMLCWKKALQYASKHLQNEKLFFNCNPYLVEAQKCSNIKALFDQSNIKIENVVLEITERSAVVDYEEFYKCLRQYRDYGFKFAVDDVGGGYSSLESIVQTKPEVVKIDRHIVNNLSTDVIKRSIVKFVTSFCKENNIISVAEGIETKKDLKIITELGVDAGQGFFLSHPASEINLSEIKKVVQDLS